jgi:hypothetical protein
MLRKYVVGFIFGISLAPGCSNAPDTIKPSPGGVGGATAAGKSGASAAGNAAAGKGGGSAAGRGGSGDDRDAGDGQDAS